MIVQTFYNRYWQKTKKLSDFNYKWPVLKKFIPQRAKVKLLDFGCGDGKISEMINKINPQIDLTGIDVSPLAIKKIKKKLPQFKFKTIKENKPLPFKKNSFDFILAADVLEHIYDTELIFQELNRLLKPKGRLLISVPYYGLIKNLIIVLFAFDFVFDVQGPHIRFYTKKSLFRCLSEASFKIEQFGYFGRFYPFSRGMYVLAKKVKILEKVQKDKTVR